MSTQVTAKIGLSPDATVRPGLWWYDERTDFPWQSPAYGVAWVELDGKVDLVGGSVALRALAAGLVEAADKLDAAYTEHGVEVVR